LPQTGAMNRTTTNYLVLGAGLATNMMCNGES
jgi:hypothetical protein